jgi:hypothetical protein
MADRPSTQGKADDEISLRRNYQNETQKKINPTDEYMDSSLEFIVFQEGYR